jgi:epoxyqueuosine reductase QueG
MQKLVRQLEEMAGAFIAGHPLNQTAEFPGLHLYDAPMFGIAAANDPLFDTLKQEAVVGPDHRSPREWLPEAKSVVCYFLPLSEGIRASNRPLGCPSSQWLYSRIAGEDLNIELQERLAAWFGEQGIQAILPVLDSRYDVRSRRSNWSVRHVGYVAGLGTFGLNGSLITRKGAAGRIGTAIVDVALPPTPRAYSRHDEYCTFCGACIVRCPAGAVSRTGKDHGPCAEYLESIKKQHAPRYGCGKCQTGVPCESGIPRKNRQQA